MDNKIMMQLATNLIEVTTRNTASLVLDKIKLAKARKDDKSTINELEEIISCIMIKQ